MKNYFNILCFATVMIIMSNLIAVNHSIYLRIIYSVILVWSFFSMEKCFKDIYRKIRSRR